MCHRVCTSLLVLSAFLTYARAQPGGAIYSPGAPPNTLQFAQYGLTGSPTSETDEFDPHSFIFNAVSGGQQLHFNWFFYRVAGDAVQRPFGVYQKSDGFNINGTSSWPTMTSSTVNSSSYHWTENGASGPRFSATYSMTLSNGPTTTDALLSQSLQISNPNPTALNIALYNLAVPQPGNALGPFFASGNINSIRETNGTYDVTVSPTGASAFQSATDLSLENSLTGGPAADLNNTGLPIVNYSPNPDLISIAYEWQEVVPGNGSVTISDTIAISHAVPEPGTLALCGAAVSAGLGWAARRRKARRARAV
jgi:hypothetical protein